MKLLGIILLSVAAVTVTARHRKEWQRVDPFKLSRERIQTFYKSDIPACTRGAGFYRDPQDCHQFIRCVDEFGNGRHFSVFVGRCEPGLVFDENVSACNWPELAAPCSNSPEKFQETRKPLRPEQVPDDNIVYEEPKWQKPYPSQQQVVQDAQSSDAYETQQEEVPVVQEIQIAAQEPVYQDKFPQLLVETQNSGKPFEDQVQEQVSQENVQVPEVQEQLYQENFQQVPEIQEQVFQENAQQDPKVQQQVYQEDVQAIEQPVESEQNILQSEQQQIIYQEPSYENVEINDNSRPENVSPSGFQQVIDQEAQQFEIPDQAQQEQLPQQQTQSEWWVPEGNPQHNPPEHADQIQTSDANQDPIFCSQEGFYRHPENCSQFIRCVKIERGAYAVHFFECPKQLVFDEKDSACIVADIHSCRFSSRRKRQASNTKLQCSDEGFFRHPEDCRAFYRCVKTSTGSYETHLFSCPANLVFDEEYTTCNWPEKAPPCNKEQPYNPTRKPTQTVRTTYKTTRKPTQAERTTYKTTRKPSQTERTTYKQPSRTTSRGSWSTAKPRNDFIDKSITEETYGRRRSTVKPRITTQSYEAKCRSQGFFKNDNDCTKFFKCVKKGNNFLRYELACPQNFAYDDNSQRCIAQKYVTSCDKNKPPYPPRQDDEETTANPEPTSSDSSNSGSENDEIVCEREGYFRHPEDCNQFYRCVDFNGNGEEFVRYDFKCPEGLVFDEANSVCNWPDQSSPCDTRGNGGGGTEGEGDGNDTGGNESENEGKETEENETGGNEDNDGRGSENENSNEQSTTKAVERTTSSSVDSNEEGETGNESSDSGSENESNDSGSGNECTKEGYYRNPDDCNKFYRCVDFNGDGKEFVRYDFSCPEGLVFDEVNSVCNWPAESEPCDTRSGGGSEGGSDQDETESTTSNNRDREDESSDDNQDQSNEQSTPSDNESSGSTADRNPSSDSGSDGSQSTTESTNEGTTRSRESGGNSGECTEEGFFRNPEDCNKFYRCVDQNGDGQQYVKYDFTCPEGLVFDETNSVCNWPEQSAPCDGGSSGGRQSTTSGGEDGSESSQTTSASRDSSEDGADGTTESSASSTTERGSQTSDNEESSSGTTERSTSSPSEGNGNEGTSDTTRGGSGGKEGECTEEGYFRNPEDCTKFYRCVDFNGDGKEFVRYDFDCPDGLVFDEENSVCNWPDQSPKCETGGKSGSDDGASTSQTESSSQSSTEQSTQGPYETTQSSTQDSGERSTQDSTDQTTSGRPATGDSSACSEPGFYRCEDDCSKFYRCVDEDGKLVRYDFKCPDGLIFDDKNKKCDYPSSELTCDTESSTTQSSTTSSYESSTTAATTQSSTSSSGTSSSGSSNKECTEEGFFKNPDDCSKYYRCIDEGDGTFTREDFSCAEDEVFDEEMRYCNRKDLAPPCEDSQTTGDSSECSAPGFYRREDDCSKFYRCVDEDGQLVRYDFKCPDGLIFDDKNKKCDYPSSELTCDTESSTSSATTQSSTTSSYESSTTAATTQSSTTQSSTSSSGTSSSGSSNKECTEEGFFKNPDDCSKYYRCIDEGDGTFTREDFSCAEDEVFDEEMRYCNRKDLAPPCEDSQTTGDSSECSEPGFYRCEDDCSKFYRCVDEDGQLVRYDFKCPDGLIFDDKNKKCDYPSSELTCDTESSTTQSSTTSSYESSTTAATTQSSTSSSGTSSSESSNKECTEEGFFKNPDDCSKYYRCTDEGDGTFIREDFSCAEDEVFDEEMRYCNRKDLAPPCDDSQTTSSQSQTTTTERSTTSSQSSTQSSTKSEGNSECSEPGFYRCPEDCTKFYRCVEENGELVRYDFHCPDGLIFDDRNDKCDWPSSDLTCDTESSSTSSSTTESSTSGSQTSETASQGTSSSGTTSSSDRTTSSSNECTEEGFFRNPDDCSKYYRCTDEGDGTLTREEFACEEDEVFDEEMRYCNRKDLAPPCDSSSSTTESSSGGSTSQTSSEQEQGSTTSSSSTKSGSSSSGECEEEGFHRDPNDCSKFYRCVDFQGDGQSFTRYDFDCPEGLVFDESNDVCNWPSSVPSCESSGESGGSTGGSSSTETSSAATSDGADSSTSSTRTDEQTSSTPRGGEGTTDNEESSSDSNDASTSSDSGTTSSGGSTSSDGSTSSESTKSSGGGSSDNIECTEEGFFRHPEDCNKFYRCVDFAGTGESFVRYDFDCPEGLVFDEVNSVCNWPNMSPGCESGSRGGSDNNGSSNTESGDNSSTNSDGPSTTDNSRTTSQDTSSTNEQTTRAASTSSGEFRCEEEGYFKHPTDCKKYYECKRDEDTGELERIDCECPDGQVWDNEGWYCNAEDLSPPCDSSSSSFRCKDEGFFRDPEDCTRYYQCNRTGSGENDFTSERHQCEDGLVFDESGRYCNAPELSEPCDETSSTSSGTTSGGSSGDSSTSGTSSGQGECTEEGFFRNPEDCTKYYQCSRNENTGGFDRSDYACSDGRIFDEGSTYCNDPQLSEEPCESDNESTPRDASTSSSNGGSSAGSTTSSDGTRRSGGGAQCSEEGFFRHPEDCNKFYRCVDFSGSGESFVRFDFECPEGLHFDEVNSVCNWPTMTPPCESSNWYVNIE